MKLEHIKEDNCSVCGARAVADTQDNKHCNGQWNESRTYACGKVIEHVPNFSAQRITHQCPDEKATKAKMAARAAAKADLVMFITKLECDDVFIKELINRVNYAYAD